MENVQFDEGDQVTSFASRKTSGDPTISTMSRIFIKTGLAKNPKQVQNLMIGIIVVCILITIYALTSVFAPGLLPI